MCSYEDSRQAGCDPAIGGFVLSKITSRHGGRIGTQLPQDIEYGRTLEERLGQHTWVLLF
jgi:hypothetical protein